MHRAGFQSGLVDGLYYQLYGEGTPVVALHGLGATMYSWRYLVGPLSQNHLVYLLDLKGHGKSEKPEDGKYSLNDHAELIVQFMSKLDLQNVTIIGHSMGGAVALLAAVKVAEQTEGRLRSLVLLDPVALPQKLPILFRALQIPIVPPLALCTFPARLWSWIVLRLAYHDKAKITRDAVVEYAKNLETAAGRSALLATVTQMVPKDIDAVIELYHKIKIPTQIIWGQDDDIVSPGSAILLNTQIENSVLTMIECCGHIPHEEQPCTVVPKIIDFVNRYGSIPPS